MSVNILQLFASISGNYCYTYLSYTYFSFLSNNLCESAEAPTCPNVLQEQV